MLVFGELCIATYKGNSNWAKLANRRTPSIKVYYAEGHPTNTYQIFNYFDLGHEFSAEVQQWVC